LKTILSLALAKGKISEMILAKKIKF
jgi:hypothetical protein